MATSHPKSAAPGNKTEYEEQIIYSGHIMLSLKYRLLCLQNYITPCTSQNKAFRYISRYHYGVLM